MSHPTLLNWARFSCFNLGLWQRVEVIRREADGLDKLQTDSAPPDVAGVHQCDTSEPRNCARNTMMIQRDSPVLSDGGGWQGRGAGKVDGGIDEPGRTWLH